MANLRTNNLSGEQGQNAYRGSVQFNDADYLQIADSADIEIGSNDYTVEFWAIFTKKTSSADYEEIVNKGYPFQIYRNTSNNQISLAVDSNTSTYEINTTFGTPSLGDWHHIAVSRSGNTTKAFLNGIEGLSSTANTSIDDVSTAFTIGTYGHSTGSYQFRGVISNVRVVIGTALYTADFTPPTDELKIVDGTAILCCQDSDDPTQEATGKTITGFGDLATAGYLETQPKVIPPYGVDAGNAFGGPIQQSSQGYMYFPTGRTEERGGSRGVCAGGSDPSGRDNDISFIDIQSQGNAIDFGDLTNAQSYRSACSSFTRGYWFNGQNRQEIDTVNIKSTGNSTDFGDATNDYNQTGSCSDKTRGMRIGGADGGVIYDNIYHITMSTEGTTTSFGNLTVNRYAVASCSGATRGLTMGGRGGSPTANLNTIDYFTIQSTGDVVDFGDLTYVQRYIGQFANTTRAVAFGGDNSPTPALNNIDFVTIATTGNAADFGDLTSAKTGVSGTNSATRGLMFGGFGGSSPTNAIDFVTIASLGNATDFGDKTEATSGLSGATSDCHGGLG